MADNNPFNYGLPPITDVLKVDYTNKYYFDVNNYTISSGENFKPLLDPWLPSQPAPPKYVCAIQIVQKAFDGSVPFIAAISHLSSCSDECGYKVVINRPPLKIPGLREISFRKLKLGDLQ